jgi:radical SAM enzyme (TIGR01210 family)
MNVTIRKQQEDGSNIFLSRLMGIIRKPRSQLSVDQPFFNRIERVTAGNYGEVWFRTAGCQWDKRGGCTMCNYGTSPSPSTGAMVESVKQALAAFDQPISELMVSPSGSMLDPVEVPQEARSRIYSLIAAFPTSKVLLETRSEWITEEHLLELCASQPIGRQLAVEIGLESIDPWIRRFCINKGGSIADFVRAAKLAHQHGVEVYANVCLGTAFLSPLEAIEDAVVTVIWALKNGADHAVVFPLHVKPYTLLDTLYQRDAYAPPSLWSLVEVLRRIEPELHSKVEIAWYRSYYDTDTKIHRSPDTCPVCREDVLSQLDQFRANQSTQTITTLSDYACVCHGRWSDSLAANTDGLAKRVEAEYYRLGAEFGLDEWLATDGIGLIDAIRSRSRGIIVA